MSDVLAGGSVRLERKGSRYAEKDSCRTDAATTTPIERLLFARIMRIDFDEIIRVERLPAHREDVLPAGQHPRMRLITGSESFDFLFMSGLDDWISAVEDRLRIWDTRRKFV